MLHELLVLFRSFILRLIHYVDRFNKSFPLNHSLNEPLLNEKEKVFDDISTTPLLDSPRPSLSLSFGPATAVPNPLVHQSFQRYARSHPHLVAAEHLDQALTYQELDRLSDIVASRLIKVGVSRDTRVCLLIQRSLEMVVGIIAVLKTGASYVPLDGGIVTDDTLSGILADSQPKAILCISKFLQRADHRGIPSLNLDLEELRSTPEPAMNVDSFCLPSDEAYVIYTSGTTGRPKGVSVSHGNVTNIICTSPGNLTIQPGTRVSQLLNVAFDMCAWEVLATLTNGGTLVLRGSSPGLSAWHAVLSTVHVVISTPSILAQFDPKMYPNVRAVATAGERCPQKLADEWAIGRKFWNCCGPTETTIVNTAHRHASGTLNTIGRPTPNNSVYVLNEDLQPVPIGQVGTLWAGGHGVCRGYVNLPQLTQLRFRTDPYNPRGTWMYNTGDIGRMLPSGEFEHLGRQDDQVKVKGFRVELDGIASSIASCPGVILSAAVLVNDELHGFYTPACVSSEEVRKRVKMSQPYYAVPKTFIGLEEMPLTKNGKVDKLALKSMVSQ